MPSGGDQGALGKDVFFFNLKSFELLYCFVFPGRK